MRTKVRPADSAVGALLIALAAWLVPPSAAAQGENEFSLSISGGASYSDNIGRVSENEQSSTSADAGLAMNLVRQGARLSANVATNLVYHSYLDNPYNYSDELVGGLSGVVVYGFVPSRFSWAVEDNFGQTLIDRQAVETPGNRQRTNYFSTGPNIDLPLGGRTSLSLQARWSDVSYETSDLENQRISGTLSLNRRLSDSGTLSLSGTAQRVEYDESPPNSDYDTQTVYLGYQAAGARTTLNIRGGTTMLHDSGETTDGPLFDLSLTRQVSPRSTLSLNGGTNYTDSADAFRRDQNIRGVTSGSEDSVVSRDRFQGDYATIAWQLAGERSTFQLAADWRQEDHDQQVNLNRERIGSNFTLSHRMTSRISGNLYAAYYKEDFEESGIEFDDWSVSIGVSWSFAPGLSLSLQAGRYDGSGDTTAGPDTRDFTENRLSLTFAYSPGH